MMLTALKRLKYILKAKCNIEDIENSSDGNLHKATSMILLNKDIKEDEILDESGDYEFMFFQCIGKFLHNKSIEYLGINAKGVPEKMTSEKLLDPKTRPKSYFDPEDVVRKSCIEPGFFWQYLEENCYEFFSDIKDMSGVLEYFELADTIDNMRYLDVFQKSGYYSSSLAGRAVLNFNCHPAKTSFVSFSAPTYNRVVKKKEEKQDEIMNDCCRSKNMPWQIYANEVFYYGKKFLESIRQIQADEVELCENITLTLDSIELN